MDIKLVVSDLDDTLISMEQEISDRLMRAISETKKKDIKITIATGRMHSSALIYAKKFKITEPIISYNGAMIKHSLSGEILLHTPVEYKDAIEVLEFAKDINKYIQYYSQDNYYFYEHCENSDFYKQQTSILGKKTNADLTKTLDFSPTKLLMVCDDSADEIYDMVNKQFSHKLNITRSSQRYIEFNNIEASKAIACKALVQYYGYDIKQVMSIGNGGNDIGMIELCGFGVAVDNAVDEVKAVANYICPKQSEDGAAYAIEKFLLK